MKHLACLTLLTLALYSHAYASTTAPIAPIPTPSAAIIAPVDPTNFTFICTGDNRPPGHGDPIMPECTEICREVGLIRPDFVFWTGDTIYGYKDTPAEANAEYDAFLSTASLCGVPVFNSAGNHELTNDPAMTPIYMKRMGALYGSTDYGNSHFISLNTDPIINGVVEEGVIDPDQWTWLEADLAANTKAANIFVFMHHYVFGPPDPESINGPDTGFASVDQRDAVHKLFVKYGVRAVFCGHSHIYWHTIKDGIDYFISGNAGAPLDAPPEDGGYYGYLMVNVNGTTITTKERIAGALQTRLISGGDGISTTAIFDVDAPELEKLTIKGLLIKMPAGKTYTASATATNKGKTKLVTVDVLGTTSSDTPRTVMVRVEAYLPGSRTTIITVNAD
jgi:hypothetical protein